MTRRIPDGPRRSNCVFWAVALWLRRGKRGELVIRQSVHNPFKIHCAYESTSGRRWSYSPVNPVNNFIALCHGIRFRGRIKLER